jgi:hypothetical protein
MLLPLALYGIERRQAWLAAAALASIPLSGQVHLALGAIPFFCLYAVLRGRALPHAAAAALVAVGAGLLVYFTQIRGSIGSGRSFAQVERYSAEASDFLARGSDWSEDYVFLGWATPLLAAAGLALLVLDRRYRLAAALGIGALIPCALALGANLPGYEAVWRNLPGLHDTRVPERLMPIACLMIAALVATAASRVRWPGTAALVALLLLIDLRVGLFEPAPAEEDNRAYAAIPSDAAGRLLELPVFLPERQEASVYLYYLMQSPHEHPSGYSTLAPREADRKLRQLARDPCADLGSLGVRFVALHREGPTCGGQLLARDGPISVYEVR